MKTAIYILCIPIKLLVTICVIPLMALAIVMSFSLDGNNDADIAMNTILDIWR